MNEIKNLKTVVNVSVTFIKPINLEKLANNFQNSSKFPDMQSSFEFPPKPIKTVIKLLFNKEYEKLNFFDIARLLTQLENDKLGNFVSDKLVFSTCLQELFNDSEKYIQDRILKTTTKIFISTNENRFRKELKSSLTTKEFMFIRYCINKDFDSIQRAIKNQSLKKVLKFYGVHKILAECIENYSNYLLKTIDKKISKSTVEKYQNNLLYEDNLDLLYRQVDKLVTIIENDTSISSLIDEIIRNKLGNIEDSESKWHTLDIPLDIQDGYKRFQGLFEFQRFVAIADYLAENMTVGYLNYDTGTTDATRLINRSRFWSNYDGRFSSVKMWVTSDDYARLSRDRIVDLSDIKTVEDFDNEICMLEFKESNLLIIEFFRQKDQGSPSRKSLIFDNDIEEIKDLLDNYNLNLDLISELKSHSTYQIHHIRLWQGWVDKFLRERNIYPNTTIFNKKAFKITPTYTAEYPKSKGLQQTRERALEEDIFYKNVILKS